MDVRLPETTEKQHHDQARLSYVPGLDGLRALAVIAVLLYHAGLELYGGFLGVESFFTLSGFLITSLLFAEWQHYGRIDIRQFWVRRARRLLPALLFMLLVTLALAAVLLPGELGALGGDAVAALGYVMNWHLVASQQSYFDALLRPPLLEHLWSLAVEEQFYVVWPLLFFLGMRVLRLVAFLGAILAAATASALLMASLYQPGADPSRIYFGTDTRAAGLLIGAALALVWVPGRVPAADSRVVGIALDIAGFAALGGLLVAYARMFEYHPLLYRGGFTLVALATAVVIAAITHPRACVLAGLLSWRPLRWIGVRSYGIYLWHWPIFMIMRPALDTQIHSTVLLVVQSGLSVALAAASYRFVETPIRRGVTISMWIPFRTAYRKQTEASRRARNALARLAPVAPPPTLVPSPHTLRVAGSGRMKYNRPLLPVVFTSVVLFTAMCAGPAIPPTTTSDAAIAVRTAVPTLPRTVAPTADVTATRAVEAAAATLMATAAPTLTPTPSATATATATSTPEPSPTEVALQPIDPALAAELQRVLDATVADGYIPGAVLAVSIPGYETWTGASGVAVRQDRTPIQPDTRMRIASISKIFTAVVVLQLVEEGTIELDAPIETYLPGLLPNGDIIFVRELLQHTSGLYDYLEDRRFASRAYQNPDRQFAPSELVEYAVQFPLAFSPGSAGNWDYSSTNYVILGILVEQVTGNTLAQEMRQRIFEPLELTGTFFPPSEDVQGPQAHGYSQGADQTNVAMSFAFATANVVSTAQDVRTFGDALFAGELLQPETLDTMLTFVNGKGQYNMPALEYGLGLMRNRLPVGPGPDGQPRSNDVTTVLGHIGGFGGFRSALWHAPESGMTFALGVNQAATDPNLLATRVFDVLLRSQGR